MENNKESLALTEEQRAQVFEDMKQTAIEEVKEKLDIPAEEEGFGSRHKATYPFEKEKNIDDITEEEIQKLKEVIQMPVTNNIELEKFLNGLNSFGDNHLRNNLTDKQRQRIGAILNAERFSTAKGVFDSTLNTHPETMVNEVKYGDKDYAMQYPPLMSKGELTGNTAIAKIQSILNIGEVTQIPLWHSGFWVTMKAPTQRALINLELALANSQIQLGRETNSLIFSNYQVVFNRIIADFITQHITSYTIKVPDDKTLIDYIMVQDFHPLVLGMLACMYPNGIYNTRGCVNTAKISQEGTPVCDYLINSTLDPKKLLWVNKKALTKPMLEHMAQRRPLSMSVASVKEYQLSIAQLMEETVDLKTENGSDVKITFKTPTLAEYIDSGERWVNEVIADTEEILVDGDDEKIKNEKVNEMLASRFLGIYNTYVKEIKVNDVIVRDQQTIEDTLAAIGIEDELLTDFFIKIADYISKSAIAVVAIPSYTCPKCGADHSEGNEGPFKQFIPINVVDHFFVLRAFRINRVLSKI